MEPVALVTGASSGIGRVIAARMAEAGFRVVVTGRDPERTAAAAKDVGGEHVVADLSEQAGVRALAAYMHDGPGRLDVLVNNAGMLSTSRVVTADGVELTWAVNHLAPFLLTNLLLDLLTAAGSARVVNVTSAAQAFARLDFNDLQFERRPYRHLAAYAQSKLAMVMATIELAGRVPGIEVNCVHPGGANTGLGRDSDTGNLGRLTRAMEPLVRRLNSSADRAAAAPARLAIEGAGRTGTYFGGLFSTGVPPRPGRPHRLARDPAARRRLWELSEQMTNLA